MSETCLMVEWLRFQMASIMSETIGNPNKMVAIWFGFPIVWFYNGQDHTDHSKTQQLKIWTSKHQVFQFVWYSSPHCISHIFDNFRFDWRGADNLRSVGSVRGFCRPVFGALLFSDQQLELGGDPGRDEFERSQNYPRWKPQRCGTGFYNQCYSKPGILSYLDSSKSSVTTWILHSVRFPDNVWS